MKLDTCQLEVSQVGGHNDRTRIRVARLSGAFTTGVLIVWRRTCEGLQLVSSMTSATEAATAAFSSQRSSRSASF